MESFYGGKQGRTYNIVARFDAIDLQACNPRTDITSFDSNLTLDDEGSICKIISGSQVKYYLITRVDDLTGAGSTVELKGMVQEFSKGGAYTDANYGEYVLIDTVCNRGRKANEENGIIYRRGFNYTEARNEDRPSKANYGDIDFTNGQESAAWRADWSAYAQHPGAGAIYVGQIVGPKGSAPALKMINWETYEQEKVTVPNTHGETEVDLNPPYINGGEYDEQTGEWTEFNDTIKGAWINVMDPDGDVKRCEISFNFPRSVQKLKLVSHDPYLGEGSNHDIGIFENEVTEDHVFAYQWDAYIPAGKHGTDVERLSIETDSETGYKYLEGQLRSYQNSAAGELLPARNLAWYNIITSIEPNIVSIAPTTTIYRNSNGNAALGDVFIFYNKAESNSTMLDPQKAVCIRAGQYSGTNLIYIKEDTVDTAVYPTNIAMPDGTEFWYATNMNKPSGRTAVFRIIEEQPIQSIKGIDIAYSAAPNDSFDFHNLIDYVFIDYDNNIQVKYNHSDKLSNIGNLQEIREIYLKNKDNILESQRYTVDFSNNKTNIPISNEINEFKAVQRYNDQLLMLYASPTYRNTIPEDKRVIKDWTDPITGSVYQTDATGTTATIGNNKCYSDTPLYWEVLMDVEEITGIEVVNKGNILLPQYYAASYTHGGTGVRLSDDLDEVKAVNGKGDNIIVLYANPSHRASIPAAARQIKSWTDTTLGTTYSTNQNGTTATLANGTSFTSSTPLYWQDIGTVNSQFHMYGNFKTGEEWDNFRTSHADGLDGIHKGWIVSVETTNAAGGSTYDWWGYDYNQYYTTGTPSSAYWYKLGSIADQALKRHNNLCIAEADANGQPILADGHGLDVNGYWFVVE